MSLLAEAVPQLIAPIKLCLNTMQPQLVGGLLLLLIRYSAAAYRGTAFSVRHILSVFLVLRLLMSWCPENKASTP